MGVEKLIRYYEPMISSLAEIFLEFNPSLVDDCISNTFYNLRNVDREVSEGYIHEVVKNAAIDIIRKVTGIRADTLLIKKHEINDWEHLSAVIGGTENSKNDFFRILHNEVDDVCFGGLDRDAILRSANAI